MIHLTLNTDHARYSPRDEVDQNVLAWCQDVALEQVVVNNGCHIILPKLQNYSVNITTEKTALVATAWHAKKTPLATWWVSPDKESDQLNWDLALKHAAIFEKYGLSKITAKKPDKTPWCAVYLEIGLALKPDASAWLGDLERCLAWAWIDYVKKRNK